MLSPEESASGLRELAAGMRKADLMGLPDLRKQYIQRTISAWRGEKPPSCAIGGANVALGRVPIHLGPKGKRVTDETYKAAMRMKPTWEFPDGTTSHCPNCWISISSLLFFCIHLYDEHMWSRTQIADHLDKLASSQCLVGNVAEER